MKKQHFGFTLIELLVVIVIIGILSTISTATFKSYFGRARDTSRIAAVNQMSTMIRVDAAYNWENGRFRYSAEDLKNLFDANDYRVPKGEKSLCYIIGMGDGPQNDIGDDDEYIVMAWSEGEAAPLADGTKGTVDEAISVGLEEPNFLCTDTDWTEVQTAIEGALGGGALGEGTQQAPSYVRTNVQGELCEMGGSTCY